MKKCCILHSCILSKRVELADSAGNSAIENVYIYIPPFIPLYRTSDSFVVRLSFNIMKQLGSRVAFVRVRGLSSDSGLLFGERDDAFLSASVHVQAPQHEELSLRGCLT